MSVIAFYLFPQESGRNLFCRWSLIDNKRTVWFSYTTLNAPFLTLGIHLKFVASMSKCMLEGGVLTQLNPNGIK